MIIERAKDFALLRHEGQKYGLHDYSYHLQDVVNTLLFFDYTDTTIIASAWLHDTLEDTYTSQKELQDKFGNEITYVVYCVTNAPGKNRKERIRRTYPKIKDNDDALILKLADRISNIANCINDHNYSLLQMYKTEYPNFRENLYKPGMADKMWVELDNLFTLEK